MVEENVRRNADRPAMCAPGTTVSYRELWDLAGGVAEALTRRLDGPAPVGLHAVKSVRTHAAVLGIMRAGCTVVPLHPELPAARRAAIGEQAQLQAVLAEGDAGTIDLRGIEPCASPRDHALKPDSVAYIAFTSGSTGRPKGVPITQANITAYIGHVVDRFELGPGDRMSQLFELTFDPSMFDLFATWTSGATAILPPPHALRTVVRYLRDHDVTHVFAVPSAIALARRTRTLEPGCLPSVRCSLFGGEPVTYDHAGAWLDAAPGTVFENVYGPTELTVFCTEYRLPPDRAEWIPTSNDTVPIGTAYPGLDAVVLDADRRPARDGELCMRGVQRFAGYLDPADNEGRFVRADLRVRTGPPADEDWYRTGDRVSYEGGQLVHLGRLDRQTKVRGYRIELDEVEAVLRRHPAIEDAAVIVIDAQLHGFYVGEALPGREVRDFMRGVLPDYMVPAVLRALPAFPLNSNGKLDRAALRSLAGS